jgi:UMP-CMP kinase
MAIFIMHLMFHRTMIENMIKEGKIVPSEVTIKLLQDTMIKSENDKFLIDGFPRNEENRANFENVVRHTSFSYIHC